MFIGCVISFLIFGGLAFLISKLCLDAGLDKENKFLAILFYFLGPLIALSIVSCVIVGIYAAMGLSMSAGIEVITTKLGGGTSGLLLVIGSILTAIFSIAAVAAGPATAFTASQVSSVIAAIVIVVSKDEDFSRTWLPVLAAACYGFCMWPFAAILTFGL